MSDLPTRNEVALNALAEVRAALDRQGSDGRGNAWPIQEIDHILHVAYAKLRMDSMRRERRPATWLAGPMGTVFPREVEWYSSGKPVTALCFEVRITDGMKDAVGRKVEVRLSAADATMLGASLTGMAKWAKDKPGPVNMLEKLLPKDSVKEENET